MSEESGELYKRYRPQDFKDVVGQDEAISVLVNMAKSQKFPHTLLFTGPSGCGKTTLARIVRKKLKCADIDFSEVNAANDKGIDLVRGIQNRVGLSPIGGPCRVWIIDESHQLTPQAQDAFLKLLEDTPKHVYFMLATTDPGKLKKTIITRCTEIRVKALTPKETTKMINDIAQKEGKVITADVCDKIAEISEGSARKSLVLLNQILGMSDEDHQLDALQKADTKRQAFELCQLLLKNASWKEVAAVLRDIDDEPESIRWMVLGYMANVALKAGPASKRAVCVIEAFQEPFYESKKAGLVQAAFVCCG